MNLDGPTSNESCFASATAENFSGRCCSRPFGRPQGDGADPLTSLYRTYSSPKWPPWYTSVVGSKPGEANASMPDPTPLTASTW
jgi:hypothetical protein